MNQEDLAKRLNVSRQAISKWERNESVPDLDKLLIMSKVFNVTVDDLLDGEYDLENYVSPDANTLYFFDIETQKLISLGVAIISVLSAIMMLFSLVMMYKMANNGLTLSLEINDFFGYLIKSYKTVLLLLLTVNLLFANTGIVIYQLYRDGSINKVIRMLIMSYGVLLVLASQHIIGLVYILLGFVSTNQNVKVSKGNLILISIGSILLYGVLSVVFYFVGDIIFPELGGF